jgi:hypothetical protein
MAVPFSPALSLPTPYVTNNLDVRLPSELVVLALKREGKPAFPAVFV